MQTMSVKCDTCEKELVVDSSYPHNYCLKLSSADFGKNSSGIVYAIMDYPHIKREHHFCNLQCLKDWVVKP